MSRRYLNVISGGRTVNFDNIDAPLPSQIIPSIEKIRSSQRSLNGRLHVDIVANIQKLEIIFDVLYKDEFECLCRIFPIESDKIDPDGLYVEYFGINSIKYSGKFFVEDISFTPLILSNEILWQNVVVQLSEIGGADNGDEE